MLSVDVEYIRFSCPGARVSVIGAVIARKVQLTSGAVFVFVFVFSVFVLPEFVFEGWRDRGSYRNEQLTSLTQIPHPTTVCLMRVKDVKVEITRMCHS